MRFLWHSASPVANDSIDWQQWRQCSLDGFHRGSIISPKIVVTAAHCITDPDFYADTFVVVAGIFYLKNVSRSVKFSIDKALPHPKWQKKDQFHVYYDAGLIFTRQVFLYTAAIQPLCLPPVGHNKLPSKLVGHSVTVVGWGRGLENKHIEKLVQIDVTLRSVGVNDKSFFSNNNNFYWTQILMLRHYWWNPGVWRFTQPLQKSFPSLASFCQFWQPCCWHWNKTKMIQYLCHIFVIYFTVELSIWVKFGS